MSELNTLNLTLPIKQDLATKAKLMFLQNRFNTTLKKQVEAGLAKSNIVHFARFVLIGDDYLQILTEYDGDFRAYSDFFAKELGGVFEEIFALVDGKAPDISDFEAFFNFIKAHDIQPIGQFVYTSYPGWSTKGIKLELQGKPPK